MKPFTTLFDAARRRLGGRPTLSTPDAPDRRAFLQRAGAVGTAAVGVGLLTPDDAWAGVESRADRFGIVPGTLVDANGRRLARAPLPSEPYLGEIMAVGFNFAPRGWAFCQGQLLPINQNQSLYSLLGTTYGGDGRTTFGLPDLQGRVAVQFGQGNGLSEYTLGQKGGAPSVTLNTAQIPSHTHSQPVSGSPGTTGDPNGQAPAVDSSGDKIYADTATTGRFQATTAGGGSQSHENRPPTLAMYYAIALQGIFPSRN